MKTKTHIDYYAAPYGHIARIPAGTEVQPAGNLPDEPNDPLFWAREWPFMTEDEEVYGRNYGFLLRLSEVEGRQV